MKEMIKKYKNTMIISSLIILIPIIAGVLLWNKLPDVIPTHWGVNNEPNGYSSKAFAVFGLPLILLTFQWICLLGTSADPKRNNINDKMMNIVLWIIPVIAVLGSALCYTYALGINVNVGMIIMIFISIVFIITGNYMPKCKQTYTMGIKIPWTLNDEENWNKTHRMAGGLWVICGLIMLVTSPIADKIYMLPLVVMLVMVFVPVIYSYLLYRKKTSKTDNGQQ